MYLIGYSGGASVAVMAVKVPCLPDHPITRTVLLAPTLAFDYNLQPALSRGQAGYLQFLFALGRSSPSALLMAGVGTSEGRHTIAAGILDSKIPTSLGAAERKMSASAVVA